MLNQISRLVASAMGSILTCGKNLRITRFKALLALILLLLVVVVPVPVWASQEDAATAISSLKNTLLECYNAAKEAETAGSNITVIIGTLNEAGSLLSQAELAYAMKDFDVALSLALQSQNSLNNFIAEANALKETATQQQNQAFLINVVGSITGTFAVVVAGFAVWLLMKRKYGTAGAHASESSSV
jgi:uncharacterized Tic20 family protein